MHLTPQRGTVDAQESRPPGASSEALWGHRHDDTVTAWIGGVPLSRPPWAPSGIDLTRPSAARVYDYYLGGSHNFAVDREMADEAIRLWPELPLIMQSNRNFLRRAVQYVTRQGITQFIDIGSGIPTAGNVHEVAQRANPAARVVYVDNDPVAVTHSRAILADTDGAVVIQADLRSPESIFDDAVVHDLLELDKPVALLLVAVLHFVPDQDDPYALVAQMVDRLAPGSYLVLSHASSDGQPELAASHQELYQRTPTPMTMRTGTQIERFFGGVRLISPGLVPIPAWRPDDEASAGPAEPADEHAGARMVGYAGVGVTS